MMREQLIEIGDGIVWHSGIVVAEHITKAEAHKSANHHWRMSA